MSVALVDRDSIVNAGTDSQRPRRAAWYVALTVVFLVGAFTLFLSLGESKSLGSHEGYAIVPAREMLLSSDYIVPRFGELPRLKKPPLIYWSIIAAAKITGSLDIWSARLPAAISGILLGGLMAGWAYRWYGKAAAVGAAAAQLTSVYVLVFARKAEADMILVLLIAAALCLVATHDPTESRRTSFLRWAGIWTCAAISWLGKFHFGPAMIFAPAIAWIVFERRWRFLLGMCNPVGLLVFAAAAGIWPALVLQRLPEAWGIWQEETIGRAVGELGRQPIWFYFPHLATWTLPWTIFAVMAWPASWKAAFGRMHFAQDADLPRTIASPGTGLHQRIDTLWRNIVIGGDSRERFLWIWLAVTFAIVTVSANKHPHYILPALPAFSLWTGLRFSQLAAQAGRGERLLSMPLAAGLTFVAAGALAGLFLVPDRLPDGLTASSLLPLVGGVAVSLAIAGWLLCLRWNHCAAAVVAIGWLIASTSATVTLIPSQDHRLGAYAFAEEARARYGREAEIGIYGIDKDAAAWYLGDGAFRAETPGQIADRLEEASLLRLLTVDGRLPELSQTGDLRLVARLSDQPGLPSVELGHYRQLVLVEVTARSDVAGAERPGLGRH